MLGYGPAQVYSYFERPSAPMDSFLPEVQERLIGAEEVRRAREGVMDQFAADDAVNEILDEAQNTDTETLAGLLTSDPRIMRSPQFPILHDYVKTRRELEKPSPYSDMVLAPQFSSKIQDPMLRKRFEDRVVSGVPFQQAKSIYLDEAHNTQNEMKLAEAGVPRQQWAQLQRDGLYDPASVAEATRQLKQQDPDDRIRSLQYAIEHLNKQADPITGALSPENQQLMDLASREYESRLQSYIGGQVNPTQGQPAAPVAPVTDPPSTPIPLDESAKEPARKPLAALKTPEQRRAEEARMGGQAEEERAISRAWTTGKEKLAEGLVQLYPDREDRLGVLAAIYRGEKAPAQEGEAVVVDDFGNRQGPDYAEFVFKQLGVKPGDSLFDEPGNKRWGSQKVRYNEVLRALAKDALEAEGYELGEGGAAEPAPTAKGAISPAAKAIIDEINKGSL